MKTSLFENTLQANAVTEKGEQYSLAEILGSAHDNPGLRISVHRVANLASVIGASSRDTAKRTRYAC